MRIAGNIVGVLMLVLGILWLLQGSGYIGGSAMSGSQMWANIGGLVGGAGIVLLVFVNRRKPPAK